LLALLLPCLVGPRAAAQPAPPPGQGQPAAAEPAPRPARDFFTVPSERWTIQFEPAAWYVAPGGKATLPGSPSGTPMMDVADLNLDSPRFTPFGELHLRAEDWRVTLSGFAFSEDDRGAAQAFSGRIGSLPFSTGDRLVSSLDIAVFEANAGYRFRPPALQGDQFKASIEALGGVRFYNVEFGVTGPAGSTSSERFFGHPFVGAKLSMGVLRDFTIDVQLDAGYFPSDSGGATGYDVLAGFMWHPTENVGVQIGYRDLAYFLRSGSGPDRFNYEGALQGLYIGAVGRF
jgi:hypothetical protein